MCCSAHFSLARGRPKQLACVLPYLHLCPPHGPDSTALLSLRGFWCFAILISRARMLARFFRSFAHPPSGFQVPIPCLCPHSTPSLVPYSPLSGPLSPRHPSFSSGDSEIQEQAQWPGSFAGGASTQPRCLPAAACTGCSCAIFALESPARCTSRPTPAPGGAAQFTDSCGQLCVAVVRPIPVRPVVCVVQCARCALCLSSGVLVLSRVAVYASTAGHCVLRLRFGCFDWSHCTTHATAARIAAVFCHQIGSCHLPVRV
jgi:hypothetical protein